MKDSKSRISIPNILTLMRILLIPLFVICLQKRMLGYALIVFIVAAASDALDGLIARLCNQQTQLGAYMDPIADKLLMAAGFVSLSYLRIIPPWVTIIVISRDVLIIIGIAVLTIFQVRYAVRPSMISKCTTTAQLMTVLVYLLQVQSSMFDPLVGPMLWIAAGLTTFSGLHYVYIGMNILQQDNDDADPPGMSPPNP